MLTTDNRATAEALVARYPVSRSALLPLLHLFQSQDGCVSEDAIAECAELLALTKAEVGAVATFYTMYKRAPMGDHLISVCTNFSCKVRGGQEVYDRLSERLGVGHDGTTADGALTLEHAECLGNCEGAPVVTVDYLNYECLSPDDAEALVAAVARGPVPRPTRGFPSAGIRPTSHRLAGAGSLQADPEGRSSLVDTAGASTPPPTSDPTHPVAAQGGALHDGEDEVSRGPQGATAPQGGAAAASADLERSAGPDASEVERESGYSSREMPTTAPDDGDEDYPSGDPRRDDPSTEPGPGTADHSTHPPHPGAPDRG